jgi:hypothetical protein
MGTGQRRLGRDSRTGTKTRTKTGTRGGSRIGAGTRMKTVVWPLVGNSQRAARKVNYRTLS